MKYIIVGGVAGGATTAARLRRLSEDAEIILFEKGSKTSDFPTISAARLPTAKNCWCRPLKVSHSGLTWMSAPSRR